MLEPVWRLRIYAEIQQRATATIWASKNGIESVILPSGKAGFAWTDDDIERFKNRPKRGRRWNKEVDQKIVIG